VSPDGRYLAYALSEAGSDWRTIRVLEVETALNLPDELRWTKWLDRHSSTVKYRSPITKADAQGRFLREKNFRDDRCTGNSPLIHRFSTA